MDMDDGSFPILQKLDQGEPFEGFNQPLLLDGGDDLNTDVAETAEQDTGLEKLDFDEMSPLHPRSSFSSFTAGELLMGSSPLPVLRTAGDVIRSFQPNEDKRDVIISENDLFQSEVNGQPIVFDRKGASKAVQHFFSAELSMDDASDPSDVVDADGKSGSFQEDRTKFAPPTPLGVTSASPQSKGAQPTKCCTVNLEEEFRYKMNKPERGCFVIFNHEIFDMYNETRKEEDHLKVRKGTHKDALNLENAVRQIGFEYVKIINNPTRSEILQWIGSLSTADHSNYDCFGCAILTHGGDRDILYSRDAVMHVSDFTRPFGADRCSTLATKPKLFFIQACRGTELDHGKRLVKFVVNDSVDGNGASSGDAVDGSGEREVTIPAEADFLIANSTVPEYYSWRNESNGSFFIQSLCAVLNRFGDTMEIMQIMTRVNRMVAYEYESSSDDEAYNKKKQIPSVATRLTAELFLAPKRAFEQTLPSSPQTSRQVQSSTTTIQYESSCQTVEHDGLDDSVDEEYVIASTTSAVAVSESRNQTCTNHYPETNDSRCSHAQKAFYPPLQSTTAERRSSQTLEPSQSPRYSPSHRKTAHDGESTSLSFRRFTSSSRVSVPKSGIRKLSGGVTEIYSRSLDSTVPKSETVTLNLDRSRPGSARSSTGRGRNSSDSAKRPVQPQTNTVKEVNTRRTNKEY